MSYLDNYINNFKKETNKSTVSHLIFDLIILNTPNISRDVRRRWLIGESIDGGVIGTYASDEYASFKARINPLANGNVDLTLTGSLGEKIQVRKVSGNKFEIFSTDKKYKKIGEKYGFEEFGLNELQENELLNELYEFALETIMKKVWASA